MRTRLAKPRAVAVGPSRKHPPRPRRIVPLPRSLPQCPEPGLLPAGPPASVRDTGQGAVWALSLRPPPKSCQRVKMLTKSRLRRDEKDVLGSAVTQPLFPALPLMPRSEFRGKSLSWNRIPRFPTDDGAPGTAPSPGPGPLHPQLVARKFMGAASFI